MDFIIKLILLLQFITLTLCLQHGGGGYGQSNQQSGSGYGGGQQQSQSYGPSGPTQQSRGGGYGGASQNGGGQQGGYGGGGQQRGGQQGGYGGGGQSGGGQQGGYGGGGQSGGGQQGGYGGGGQNGGGHGGGGGGQQGGYGSGGQSGGGHGGGGGGQQGGYGGGGQSGGGHGGGGGGQQGGYGGGGQSGGGHGGGGGQQGGYGGGSQSGGGHGGGGGGQQGGYGVQPSFPNTGSGGSGYPSGGGGDTSDPCFTKYKNCIIVNAQPYERRSTIDVEECKALCLASNEGVFQCRAFVYDNHNQVCDLFAHTGNQHPARLIQFYGRDYYEPTGKTDCSTDGGEPGEPSEPGEDTCPAGQEARYLRIEGFELSGSDDQNLGSTSETECIAACTANQGGTCLSFDFANGECTLSTEAAVPTGNGQLVQNPNADYYEKMCLDSSLVANCPDVFERLPQMILVGFAETVVDANSFDECLSNCLNSRSLYGFDCVSGMYYFEEPQLNCILNTEDRNTQPDLFTEENQDIVDYFELGCNVFRSRIKSRTRSRFAGRRRGIKGAVFDSDATDYESEFLDLDVANAAVGQLTHRNTKSLKEPKVSTSFSNDHFKANRSSRVKINVGDTSSTGVNEWTAWAPCDRSREGRSIRYRNCGKPHLTDCESETTWCNRDEPIKNVLNVSKGTRSGRLLGSPNNSSIPGDCPLDTCCPTEERGCSVGIMKTNKGKLIWCLNPCGANKN